MAIHIIIDGYNLIRQSGDLGALDAKEIRLGRDALIDRLVIYKRMKGHRISVVFDGMNASSPTARQTRREGIDIIFSSMGELADTVIKKMAAREKERALVVTSDREIESYAHAQGANVISSPAFEDRLLMARYVEQKGDTEETDGGWIPTTRKKGPRRKLSKRNRRAMVKINKL